MPMRLSGLMSGMDTESIISQLVEAKKTKVTKAVKAQKSLKYKQDAWKDLNTKIKNLHMKTLSNLRFESSFVKKTTKVSNSSVVSVITGEGAMNCVQSLTVEDLARSAYLTGGKMSLDPNAVKDASGKVTGSTTLAELGLAAGQSGTIKVDVKGEGITPIKVDGSTTVSSFVNALKQAGLNANFDEANGRIHVAAKTSGADSDFTISADSIAGLEALQALGLEHGGTQKTVLDGEKQSAINSRIQGQLANLTAQWNNLTSQKSSLDADKTNLQTERSNLFSSISANSAYVSLIDGALAAEGSGLTFADAMNGTLSQSDLAKIDRAVSSVIREHGADKENYPNLQNDLSQWINNANAIAAKDDEINKLQDEIDDVESKLTFDSNHSVTGLAAAEEQRIKDHVDSMLASTTLPSGKKTDGADAKITLNGVEYTSSTNSFNVNGLTLTVNAKTGENEEVTITTQDDTDGIYDMIKGFLKEYNALINEMDKLYNADSAKGYDPLTDEEKEAMSDSAIEEWENKIKESILRKDSTLSTISSEMKQIMMGGVEVNGKTMYLSNFGINTLNYFVSADNEKNAYHIDGDSDDAETSGNADKLKSMIANDPDTVVAFFTGLSKNLYNRMSELMGPTEYSSAFTAYDDKKMQIEYDEYTTKIKELEDKLADYEDKWYAKFAAMETALAKMQNNASAVMSLLGG